MFFIISSFFFRAASLAAESANGTNPNENVRYIRRRKFGQKRRSIIVKRRTPINNKSNKNDSMITHDDSSIGDIITNDDDDERSQEYVSRRRIPIIDESIKEEPEPEQEAKEEEEEEENKTIPISSSPKVSVKQPILKQLKLDQFLKVVQTIDEEKLSLNLEIKNEEINNDDIYAQTRRITRNTRLHSTSKSEAEPIKIETESIKTETETNSDILIKPDRMYTKSNSSKTKISNFLVNHQDSLTRQLSEGNISITSSNDSSTSTLHSSSVSNMDRPIPLKKRSLTSSNIQALIDNTISPSKVRIQFSYELNIILHK